MIDFFQTVANGLIVGSVYGLIALGISLIFGVSRVLNLAQGEFLMIGAFAIISLSGVFKLPFGTALPLAVLSSSFIGYLLYMGAIRPARHAPLSSLLIITLGASITVRGFALLIWGKDPLSLRPFSGYEPVAIKGVLMQSQGLWVIGVTAILVLTLQLFFKRTFIGKAMLACAENPMAASLTGINVTLVTGLAYTLSATIGAIAGIFVVPITSITYDGGILIGLKGFVGAMLGRLTPMGGLIGGITIGLMEAFAARYISSIFKDVIVFAFLLLILSVKSRSLRTARFV